MASKDGKPSGGGNGGGGRDKDGRGGRDKDGRGGRDKDGRGGRDKDGGGGHIMDWSFLGNVADAIPQITGQFNKGYQQNQLAIAQANARAAQASARSTIAQPQSKTIIWVAAIVGVLIIVALMFK